MALRILSPLEARVLAVLVEKSHTVPDSYPMSLNSLVSGCNQKTAREPVMNVHDGEVQGAVDALRALSLVFESSGSRVARYEHNMVRGIGIPSQSVALLSTLILRGPQTSAELRANCERMHRFADISSVEGFLTELAERASEKGGPLVLKLPRAPGAREARWAHLVCGPIDISSLPVATDSLDSLGGGGSVGQGELAALKAQHAALQLEIDDLRRLVDKLYAELGIARD